MATRWLVFLALAPLGCSNADLAVSAMAYGAETDRAVQAWNTALAEGPCPELGLYTIAADADVYVVTGPGSGRRAFTRGEYVIVVDEAKTRLPDVATVIAHELGHALGVGKDEHSPDPKDLIYWTLPEGRPPTPTAADVARV